MGENSNKIHSVFRDFLKPGVVDDRNANDNLVSVWHVGRPVDRNSVRGDFSWRNFSIDNFLRERPAPQFRTASLLHNYLGVDRGYTSRYLSVVYDRKLRVGSGSGNPAFSDGLVRLKYSKVSSIRNG